MKDLLKTISIKEWQFVGLISFLVIILIFLPIIFGWLNTPQNSIFLGLHSLISGDILVYYSYIEQIKEGQIFFKDLYTSESQSFGFLNIFWLALGILAKGFNLSNILIFQLAKLVLIPVLVAALYLFVSYYFFETTKRQVALFFLVFASGWGGLLSYLFKDYNHWKYGAEYFQPLDLWANQTNVFLASYQSPHFIFSLILLVLFFLFLLLAFENNNYKLSIVAGISALILFQFHPYHLSNIILTIFIFSILLFLEFPNQLLKFLSHSILAVTISLPSLIYHFWLLNYNWVLSVRASQNITYLPPFFYVFLGFGGLLILGILGLGVMFKKRDFSPKNLLIFSWFFATLILISFKSQFQRQYLSGWQVPMTILAIVALVFLAKKFKGFGKLTKNKILLIFLFVIFFGFSNLFVIIKDIVFYKQMPVYFYLNKDKLVAFNWLKKNVNKGEVILASQFNSWLIPSFSAKTVFLGHGDETIFSSAKGELANKFFISSDKFRLNFLKQNKIDYLFWSAEERKLANFGPAEKNYLKPVFQNEEAVIYQAVD